MEEIDYTIVTVSHLDSLGRKSRSHRDIRFSCQECGKLSSRRYKRNMESHLLFCGASCGRISKRKGGKLRQKYETTCLGRYGVKDPTGLPSTREKRFETCLKKYGTRSHLCRSDLRRKWMMDKYGVSHHMKIPSVVRGLQQLVFERHGVKSPFLMSQSRISAAETRKKFSMSSKIESEFGLLLRDKFGEVKSQVLFCHRPIDFYVPGIETFVQVDGMYWHGLNRPLCDIREAADAGSICNRAILIKFSKDRAQDRQIRERKIKLVRITDVEIKRSVASNSVGKLMDQICSAACGRVLYLGFSPNFGDES